MSIHVVGFVMTVEMPIEKVCDGSLIANVHWTKLLKIEKH